MRYKNKLTRWSFIISLPLLFDCCNIHVLAAAQYRNLSRAKKLISAAPQKKQPKKEDKRLPASLGRTHFIVGLDHTTLKQEQQKKADESLPHLCSSDGRIKRALFTPDDNIRETLIKLINSEQNSIKIAVFSFTDQSIASALLKVAANGILVEIVTDPSALHDPFGKIAELRNHNICIFIYKPIHNKSIIIDKMHNKFIVFGKNIQDKSLLWTGSFNFTKSASSHNQENVVILDDDLLINQFNQQFNRLKQRSKRNNA